MSERYTKLFALEKDQFCPGSPLIICAGALLMDNYSKKLLAQLKFKNIENRTINSVKISITMLDSAGREFGEPIEYQYLDLNIKRDDEFGQKTAFVLQSPNVRSYRVAVTEILFDDSTQWIWDKSPWQALNPMLSLKEALGDEELASQYRIRYGLDCEFEPQEQQGLWFCTCGAVNHLDERSCHSCHRVYSALKDVNISSLRCECAERLKAENEQQQEAVECTKEKRKKRHSLYLALIPLTIIIALIIVFVPGEVKKARAYDSAANLLASGKYAEAESAFEALGNYRNSAAQVKKNIPYEKALNIMHCAEKADPEGLKLIDVSLSSLKKDDNISLILYQAAAERFGAIGDYRDSLKNQELCLAAIDNIHTANLQAEYDKAVSLLKGKNYLAARDAFQALGDFSDSPKMVKEAVYQKALSLYSFMENNDIRSVYAKLSTDTELPSEFSLSKDAALSRAEGFVTELKDACGGDKADISLDDKAPEGFLPYYEALTNLFTSLGEYEDSSGYIAKIQDLCDYTKDFFNFVNDGNVQGAYDWLNAYEEEFENRDRWLELLELYMPFCGSWQLSTGDTSLIPTAAGKTEPCNFFTSSVVVGLDTVTLRINVSGNEEYTFEFTAEAGTTRFSNSDYPPYNYLAAISVLKRLAFMKFDDSGNMISSCDYSRAG